MGEGTGKMFPGGKEQSPTLISDFLSTPTGPRPAPSWFPHPQTEEKQISSSVGNQLVPLEKGLATHYSILAWEIP